MVDDVLGRASEGHSHEEPERNLREAWELGHSHRGASEVRTWEEALHHEEEARSREGTPLVAELGSLEVLAWEGNLEVLLRLVGISTLNLYIIIT